VLTSGFEYVTSCVSGLLRTSADSASTVVVRRSMERVTRMLFGGEWVDVGGRMLVGEGGR